jgi:16S rRNA (guanine(966)-N(2))-methyltransferase RsmD
MIAIKSDRLPPERKDISMVRPERKPQGRPERKVELPESRESVGLRIIGGLFRGRKLVYSGDMRTRPMKDRLREAIFNLIGPEVKGKHAIDLFAGTGALAFEAISRGAAQATLIEQHFPTANIIRQNAASLEIDKVVDVVSANAFFWGRRAPKVDSLPWVVFCSPPYKFYVERTAEMLELIRGLMEAAPVESIFVVESDDQFDFQLLPDAEAWDVRPYAPAVVGIYQKEPSP